MLLGTRTDELVLTPIVTLLQYLNDGSGNFTRRECGVERGHPMSYHAHALAFDADNDGDMDLVVAPESKRAVSYEPTSTLFLNDGDGTFEVADAGDLSRMPGSIDQLVNFDMDGDGDQDILVVLNSPSPSFALLNDGTGRFHHSQLTTNPATERGAIVRDLDGDGDMDVYLFGYGRNTMYTNCGRGFTGSGNTCILSSSPGISAVFPVESTTFGDVNMIVRGTNLLDTSDASIMVDGVPCASTTYISDTTWLCRTPQGRPGQVRVTAESIGRSATADQVFRYSLPTIESISPDVVRLGDGAMSDPQTFTIRGSDFGHIGTSRSVLIGTHECANVTTDVPHSELSCTVSASSAFFHDLDVHNVTLNVGGHTVNAPSAVCHKQRGGFKCLCGAGREQTDGTCAVCPAGEYNIDPTSESCSRCPAGATCIGGTSIVSAEAVYDPVSGWRTFPGFWASASVWSFCSALDDPACFLGRVESCAADNARTACPGGAPGTCGVGFDSTSNLCGRCSAGYSRDEITQSCTRCEGKESAYFQVVGILTGVVILLLVVFAILKRSGVTTGVAMVDLIANGLDHPVLDIADDAELGAISGLINILTGYLQVIGQTMSIFSIDFPAYLVGLLDVLSWFTLPVFNFMGAQCFAYFTTGYRYDPFLMGFSFQAALPLFIVFFYFCLYGLMRLRSSDLGGSIFVKVVCFLLVYIHPSVSAMMFRLYNCRSIYAERTDRQAFLRADPDIECFTSPQWKAMAAVSVLVLVGFVVALPVAMYVLVVRLHGTPLTDKNGRTVLKKVRADGGRVEAYDLSGKPIIAEVEVPCTMLDDPRMLGMFGMLYNDFRVRFYWYQSYEIIRRMTQTAGVVVVSTLFGDKYELPFASVVAFLFAIVHALLMPFRHKSLDFLQLLVLGGQALTYFLLYSMETGIGERQSTDVALFTIQLCLMLMFVVLLIYYLLPGLRNEVIPALGRMKALTSRSGDGGGGEDAHAGVGVRERT